MKFILIAMICLLFILLIETALIKIGHVYYLQSEVPVMNMAGQDLKTQGILPTVYDFQYISFLIAS
jgi:hypothetical protein